MRLSVVICVYNTAKNYLEECLSSISSGTLNRSDYEICMVDDGSEIDYSDLVQKYSLKYTKTENCGMLAARSTGIAMASGKYIAFVDSDDTVSSNYHRPMIEAADKSDADIVINDWAFHTERSRYFCKKDATISKDIDLSGEDALIGFTSARGREQSYFVLWNKIFKSELLKAVNDDVKEIADTKGKFNFSEDVLRSFFAFKRAKRVINVHTGYYFYRQHASQSVNAQSIDSLRRQIECMALTFDTMLAEIPEGKSKEILIRNVTAWRELMSRTHYSYAKAIGYSELYPFIIKSYSVDKLKISTFADSKTYAFAGILPSNFDEIDKALISVWQAPEQTAIGPHQSSKYASSTLTYMKEAGAKITFSRGGLKLPRPIYRLKDRILLSSVVRCIGILLFKKGSKLRAFFKRRL